MSKWLNEVFFSCCVCVCVYYVCVLYIALCCFEVCAVVFLLSAVWLLNRLFNTQKPNSTKLLLILYYRLLWVHRMIIKVNLSVNYFSTCTFKIEEIFSFFHHCTEKNCPIHLFVLQHARNIRRSNNMFNKSHLQIQTSFWWERNYRHVFI